MHIIDDEDQYVNDNTNVDIDDDFEFDPNADSDERDLAGLMALSDEHGETCEWGDLY